MDNVTNRRTSTNRRTRRHYTKMKITPTQAFVLVRMKDIESGTIALPEVLQQEPYGAVVAVGPECKFTKVGDHVKFLPENFVCGFDKGGDERFIIGEGCIFAHVNHDLMQDDTPAPDISVVTQPTQQP